MRYLFRLLSTISALALGLGPEAFAQDSQPAVGPARTQPVFVPVRKTGELTTTNALAKDMCTSTVNCTSQHHLAKTIAELRLLEPSKPGKARILTNDNASWLNHVGTFHVTEGYLLLFRGEQPKRLTLFNFEACDHRIEIGVAIARSVIPLKDFVAVFGNKTDTLTLGVNHSSQPAINRSAITVAMYRERRCSPANWQASNPSHHDDILRQVKIWLPTIDAILGE